MASLVDKMINPLSIYRKYDNLIFYICDVVSVIHQKIDILRSVSSKPIQLLLSSPVEGKNGSRVSPGRRLIEVLPPPRIDCVAVR